MPCVEVVRLGRDGSLYEKELIFNPVGKAKSVVLTEEGGAPLRTGEQAYYSFFAKRDHWAATSSCAALYHRPTPKETPAEAGVGRAHPVASVAPALSALRPEGLLS